MKRCCAAHYNMYVSMYTPVTVRLYVQPSVYIIYVSVIKM